MKAMLYKIKERTENQGRITKVVHTVYGIVYLSADEQETVDQAEAALIEASNNSIAKKEPSDSNHQALQEKVTQVLEGIENLGVKVEAVGKGSVKIKFKCFSLKAIIELIDYFYSPGFRRRLDDIAHALEDIIGKKICIVAAEIDRQSIQDVISNIDSNEYEQIIKFEMSCTGVDGLLHALDVFEEGYAANSVNELSKALSETVGKPVTLHTSIDMDQIRNAVKSIQDQIDLQSKGINPENDLMIPSMYETDRDELTKQNSFKMSSDYKQLQKPTSLEYFADVSPGDLGENSQSLPKSKQKDKYHTYITDSDAANNYSFRGFYPRRSPSFKTHELQPEIKSAGAQYGEKHPINLTQTAQISFSHQQYKLSLVYKKEINLQHDSFKYCVVSLCAVLSRGRIMILREKTLTRVYNLKVVNIHTGFVEQWKSLHSRPSDIAALLNDQVAVTLPSDNVIEILSTNEKSVIRSIPVEKHPSGITYHQDELYVVCEQFDNRPIVNVFNMQGDFVRKVELDIEQLSTLNLKIAVSTDLQSLYVADYWSGSLISFSSHGKVTARYRFGLLCPKGLTMLDDGSLLFFSEKADPIRHISADLQQDYVLEVDKGYIYYMGFDLFNKLIYVCFRYDIYVYCLEEQSNICLKAETNITSLQDEGKSSSFKTEDSLASLKTIYTSSSDKTQSKLVSHKTKNTLRSLKTEERLGSVKTEDKLSSLKTEDKLSSLKTEDKLGSLKTVDKLSSLKAEGKLTSLKAEDILSFLKTDEKLSSLKDEDTLSSLKTLEKLSFAKAEDKLSSLKTKYNISSLKTEERLGFLKTGDKLSSFKTEDKLSSLKTEDSLSSLKTEDKLSSLKTEGKLTSLKTEDKLSSLKTEGKLTSLKTEDELISLITEGMLTSLKTQDKSSSVNTKENKVNAFTAKKEMSSSKSENKLTNFIEKKIHNSQICELS